jgi:hypothetical protein
MPTLEPKGFAGFLGRNTLYDRLNEQINGTAACSTSVSLDAGDD